MISHVVGWSAIISTISTLSSFSFCTVSRTVGVFPTTREAFGVRRLAGALKQHLAPGTARAPFSSNQPRAPPSSRRIGQSQRPQRQDDIPRRRLSSFSFCTVSTTVGVFPTTREAFGVRRLAGALKQRLAPGTARAPFSSSQPRAPPSSRRIRQSHRPPRQDEIPRRRLVRHHQHHFDVVEFYLLHRIQN